MADPTIIPGLDAVDQASLELLNAIIHVATRPGCTLANLNRYVSDLRDRIMAPAAAKNRS